MKMRAGHRTMDNGRSVKPVRHVRDKSERWRKVPQSTTHRSSCGQMQAGTGELGQWLAVRTRTERSRGIAADYEDGTGVKV